jgi:hypothetical protein
VARSAARWRRALGGKTRARDAEVTGCRLQVAGCRLHAAGCRLQAAACVAGDTAKYCNFGTQFLPHITQMSYKSRELRYNELSII